MLLIVVCVVVNERTIKIPPEIALLAFAFIVGVIFKVLLVTGVFTGNSIVIEDIDTFGIEDVLMKAMLCFMLFSGSSDLKFKSLLSNIKSISLLSLLTTVVTALVYGGLFYLLARLFGLDFDFALCVLLGAIVSPTDPIAATGILNKLGLPDDITAIMEGESLFNDGTGVALFIFVRSIVTQSESGGFFTVMLRELVGAIIVGVVVSFICSFLIRLTQNPAYHVLISLLAVSSCYVLGDKLDCSGVIASVICGIYFATVMDKYRKAGIIKEDTDYYEAFWSTVDKIFNYVLYILIGLSFVHVVKIEHLVIIIIAVIVINFIARYVGVLASVLIMKKVPDGYSYSQFTTLMTWSGLKGGLCLALVMSIINIVSKDQYSVMLSVVFATVLFTTVIQGLTVARLYLGLEKKVGNAAGKK